ncbi:DUF1624 domain-containing protein [Flectobacillus roseus]
MKHNRQQSIDFLRGLVMVIMAIDHIRDLMLTSEITQDPTDLASTTPSLFFTRWITHFCAPTFVFLSGVSAYLSSRKHHDWEATKRFLITRGLWLILLEFTIVGFGIWFDIQFRSFLFQVIGSIGMGMILLAFVFKLSPKVLAIISLVLIFGHNALGLVPAFENPVLKFLWALFISPNLFPIGSDHMIMVMYPVLPWFGIMLAGFVVGRLYELDPLARKKNLTTLFSFTFIAFIVIRAVNIYGDPRPWSVQESPFFTILSFVNTTKYAPSLLFTLMTLSFALGILLLTDGKETPLMRFFGVYGKVPLFYYLFHWYIIHSLTLIMVFMQGFTWESLEFGVFKFGRPAIGSGVSLGGVYLVWIGVVLSLFPLCLWYGKYKASHPEKQWLRYL